MRFWPMFMGLRWGIHETMSYREAGSKYTDCCGKISTDKENLNMTMRKKQKKQIAKRNQVTVRDKA